MSVPRNLQANEGSRHLSPVAMLCDGGLGQMGQAGWRAGRGPARCRGVGTSQNALQSGSVGAPGRIGSLQEFHGEVSGDAGCAGQEASRTGRSTDRPKALASGSLSGVQSSVPPAGA